MNLVGGDNASIYLFRSNKLQRVYATYPELYNIKPKKSGLTYEVFRTRVSFIRNKKDLVGSNPMFSKLPFHSNIILPLNYGHISLGVLSVYSKKRNVYTQEHLDLLNAFAPLATLAIRKAQFLEETEKVLERRNLFT